MSGPRKARRGDGLTPLAVWALDWRVWRPLLWLMLPLILAYGVAFGLRQAIAAWRSLWREAALLEKGWQR